MKRLAGIASGMFAAALAATPASAGRFLPPIESNVALSDPGETPYDERLIGVWSGGTDVDGSGVWTLRIAPAKTAGMLDVLISVLTEEPAPRWLLATAHASELVGASFLNVRRVAGYGDDYTIFEAGTCRFLDPDQASGYVLVRWSMPDDDSLQLYLMGQEPAGKDMQASRDLIVALEKRLRGEGFELRKAYHGSLDLFGGKRRTIIETSRSDLIALLERDGPEAIMARPALLASAGKGSAATFRRLSGTAKIEPPRLHGDARYQALREILGIQLSLDDLEGATETAAALLEARACHDGGETFSTITARLVLHAAGRGPELIEGAVAAAVAAHRPAHGPVNEEMLEVARLLLRTGDAAGAEALMLHVAESLDPWRLRLLSQAEIFSKLLAELGEAWRRKDGARAEIALLDRIQDAFSSEWQTLLELAEALDRTGLDRGVIERIFDKAIMAAGSSSRALVAIARTQRALGDDTAAATTLSRAKRAAETSYQHREVAQEQLEVGDATAARATLARAVLAQNTSAEWSRVGLDALTEGTAQISAGNVQQALAAIDRALARETDKWTRERMAEARDRAAAGEDAEALEIINNLIWTAARSAASEAMRIAEAQLEAGDAAAAARTLEGLNPEAFGSGPSAAGTMAVLIDLQVKLGKTEAAAQNVERYRDKFAFDDETCRIKNMAKLANWQVSLGDTAALEATRRRIGALANETLLTCDHTFGPAMAVLRESGEGALAITLERHFIEAAAAAPEPDIPRIAAAIYRPLAKEALLPSEMKLSNTVPPIDRGRLIGHAEVLAAVADRSEAAGKPSSWTSALRALAVMMYADADDLAAASELLKTTDVNLFFADEEFVRLPTKLYAVVAAAHMRNGDPDGAQRMLERIALQPWTGSGNWGEVEESWFHPFLSYFAAGIHAKRGEGRLAKQALAQAETQLTSPLYRAFLLGFVAEAQINIGDIAGANRTIERLVESAALLSDAEVDAQLLANIAKRFIEVDDRDAASLMAARALEAALQIPLIVP